jgi:hypothetical protein
MSWDANVVSRLSLTFSRPMQSEMLRPRHHHRACFIPRGNDGEARQCIAHIPAEICLLSSIASALSSLWYRDCSAIQVLGGKPPKLPLCFEQSHTTTHHPSDLHTAYVSPTTPRYSLRRERFCVAQAKNSLTGHSPSTRRRGSSRLRRQCSLGDRSRGGLGGANESAFSHNLMYLS